MPPLWVECLRMTRVPTLPPEDARLGHAILAGREAATRLTSGGHLTAQQTLTLRDRVEQGRAAASELAEAKLPLAGGVVQRLCPEHCDDDLVQEARLGLLKAAERYDYRRGKFGSYAFFWMRKGVLDLLRRREREASVPAFPSVEARNVARQHWRNAVGTLAGRHPKPDARVRVGAIDEVLGEEPVEGDTTVGKLAGEWVINPESRLLEIANAQAVWDAVTLLTPVERRVVSLGFGLDGLPALEQDEIAELLGFSGEGVRRVRKEALAKLREHMEAMGWTKEDVG